MVVMQELVAAGLGVTTIPGLALEAHRAKKLISTRLPGSIATSTRPRTANRPIHPRPPPCSPR